MNKDLYNQQKQELILEKKRMQSPISILDQLQETHYIVPADNLTLIDKAVNRGCSASLELLARYDISPNDLAQIMECDESVVKSIVETNYHADLILIDGEDATALSDENIQLARQNIISSFNNRTNYFSRVYFRPSGLDLKYCVDDITEVLKGVKINSHGRYPIDGMIYPKVESPEEILFICGILSDAEKHWELPQNSIKLQFLIESARGVELLYGIAEACRERLSGIIFGMADYGADTGISALDENHPLFQLAKMRIINVSAAFGVPSIDCMSFRYPVADKKLDVLQNKKIILSKMREVFDITTNSILLGMKGKWVGHPLQLLAAKIAFEKVFSQERLDELLEKMKIYSSTAAGAQIIGNDMADRATDRNVRSFLRRAVIKNKISPETALGMNLVNAEEFTLLNTRFR